MNPSLQTLRSKTTRTNSTKIKNKKKEKEKRAFAISQSHESLDPCHTQSAPFHTLPTFPPTHRTVSYLRGIVSSCPLRNAPVVLVPATIRATYNAHEKTPKWWYTITESTGCPRGTGHTHAAHEQRRKRKKKEKTAHTRVSRPFYN